MRYYCGSLVIYFFCINNQSNKQSETTGKSLHGKMSCHQISWVIKAKRYSYRVFLSVLNLTGVSTAVLLWLQPNFKAIIVMCLHPSDTKTIACRGELDSQPLIHTVQNTWSYNRNRANAKRAENELFVTYRLAYLWHQNMSSRKQYLSNFVSVHKTETSAQLFDTKVMYLCDESQIS